MNISKESVNKEQNSNDSQRKTHRQVKFDTHQEEQEAGDAGDKEKIGTDEMQILIDAEFTKKYPDKQLYWIFMVNFFCSIMVNVDHGSLPGCSEEVK